MKIYQLYLLSIFGGVLLALGWFPYGFAPLLFVGFVPLLIIEQVVSDHSYKYKYFILLGCTYLSFLIWNVITTWWVTKASLGGGIMAITANTLLMTMVFMAFHKVKRRIGEESGSYIFVCFWMAFEFFHLRWDLSWPWLTLGNGLANHPRWIQWYEYTGVFGGSLWILAVNCLIGCAYDFNFTKERKEWGFEYNNNEYSRNKFRAIIPVLLLPVLISYIIYYFENNKNEEAATANIVVVQPNIDPYNEKFNGPFDNQLRKMLKLAAMKTDSTTDYLIFPETAIQDNLWEGKLNESPSIQTLREFLKPFPKLKIVIGANSSRAFLKGETPTITARHFGDDTTSFYDDYNTGLQIDNTDSIQVYHKSKLVPGVEKMPFPFLFKYFEKYAISLGGTAGSYGTQEERTAFVSKDKKMRTGAVICYESIYGEFVTGYVNNGAQFISIITNDGWWGDTPGYKQHLKFGALRAIETRRWIARSANTGISCFINPIGEIEQETDWWKPAVISSKIKLNDRQTVYMRFGDYLARAAILLSALFILYAWLIRFKIIKSKQ